MNRERNDGGPVYPQNEFSAYTDDRSGMSLRDHFAGQALAGLMATQSDVKGWFKPKEAAGLSYEMADAMLAARAALSKAEGLSAGVEDGR